MQTKSYSVLYLKYDDENYFHDHNENKIFVKVVKPLLSQRQLRWSWLSKRLENEGVRKHTKTASVLQKCKSYVKLQNVHDFISSVIDNLTV